MSGPFPIIGSEPNLGGVYPSGSPHAGGANDATPGGGGGLSAMAQAFTHAGSLPTEAAQQGEQAARQAQEAREAQEAAEAAQRAREAQEAQEAAERAQAAAEAKAQQEAEQRALNTPPTPPTVTNPGGTPQPGSGSGPAPPEVIGSHPQPGSHG